jgi:hypothetical protein
VEEEKREKMTGSDDSGWSVQQQGRRTVLGYEFIAQKE